MKKILATAALTISALCAIHTLAAAVTVERKPTFNGGDANAFAAWVHERVVFPDEIKAEGISGRVTLGFTVDSLGNVRNVKVLRGLDPRLDAEAVRVVSSSPKWNPGTLLDKRVNVAYTFPVIFKNDVPNPYPALKFDIGAGTDSLEIYCVNHGSLFLRSRGAGIAIAIDPVGDFYGRKIPWGWFKGCNHILLTHSHGDHLDPACVEYLTRWSTRVDSTVVIGTKECIDKLGGRSLPEIGASVPGAGGGDYRGGGIALSNGETATFILRKATKYNKLKEDLLMKVKAVPAYNTTKGHTQFHPKGVGNGYLIDIDGFVIYVAGDSEYIPEMKRLGKVDVALLPCNQPYTMTPQQCVKAARAIRPKVLIPYHLGDTDLTPLVDGLRGSGIDVRIHEEFR